MTGKIHLIMQFSFSLSSLFLSLFSSEHYFTIFFIPCNNNNSIFPIKLFLKYIYIS